MSKSMEQFSRAMLVNQPNGAIINDNVHKAIVVIATLNTYKAFSVSPEQFELVNDVYDKPTAYQALNDELCAIYHKAIDAMTGSHADKEFDESLSSMAKHVGKLYDGLME